MQDIVKNDLEEIKINLGDRIECLAGKNILITGGAGFLGYYFTNFFLYINDTILKEPCKIICLDNFYREVPLWLRKIENNEGLEIVKADISQMDFPSAEQFDYIVHAASIASPTFYRKFPIETMDANVKGLWTLLEYCKEKRETDKAVESFLFFSSSEIYGDPPQENIPTPETYRGNVSCTGPRACYDESKRFGETLCVNFYKVYGIPVKIARPFNNYGPGLRIDDRRVIPDFCHNVMNRENIILLSDGSAKRTFCYITDAITGYLRVLLSDFNGEVFNIGVKHPEISMRELAELVIQVGEKVLGIKKLKVIGKVSGDRDYLVDNPSRRCPSIEKATELLGYSPKVDLKEGLRRSLLWYTETQSQKNLEQVSFKSHKGN